MWKKWLEVFRSARVPEARTALKYFLEDLAKGERLQQCCKGEYNVDELTLDELEGSLSKEGLASFERMCSLRLQRMPVQYVLGSWHFRERVYEVRPPVLIPRPETEDLVDLVLQRGPHYGSFLEVGCGSGCVSVELLLARSGLRGTAIDISREACDLTAANSRKHGVQDRLQVVCTSFREFVDTVGHAAFSIAISNPPYIPTSVVDQLDPDVRLYEDRRALDGGQDGLDVVRELLSLVDRLLERGGCLYLELDLHQWREVRRAVHSPTLTDRLEFQGTFPDFTGRLRFCQLRVT